MNGLLRIVALGACGVGVWVLVACSGRLGAEAPGPGGRAEAGKGVVAPGEKLVELASGFKFTEGPAVDEASKVTMLARTYGGKPFNKPNDLWADPKGGIYFTDPRAPVENGAIELSRTPPHAGRNESSCETAFEPLGCTSNRN